MINRNIDAPWDTDEPYLNFDFKHKYKEVKFNGYKGFVSGSFLECVHERIYIKKEFWDTFSVLSPKTKEMFTIETKKSVINGYYEKDNQYSLNSISYIDQNDKILELSFIVLTAPIMLHGYRLLALWCNYCLLILHQIFHA